MIFETKTYRNSFSKERFQSFVITYKDSDLWIAVDHASFKEEMAEVASQKLAVVFDELEAYLAEDSFFKKSLKPCAAKEDAPGMIRQLAAFAEKAGVGPMAGVSGMFIECVGQELLSQFKIVELIVEKDSELFVKLQNPLIVSIFADDLDNSGLMGLEIFPEQTPAGIGTGLASRGKPINYGKAQSVMILGSNAAYASALAVGAGNRLKKPADLNKALKELEQIPEVAAAVFMMEDQLAVHGENELKLIF